MLQLEKAGHRCTSIRGDLDHQLRDRVVNEFRTGITKILIATDVLSRGFDVTQACAPPGCQCSLEIFACHESLHRFYWACGLLKVSNRVCFSSSVCMHAMGEVLQ